MVASCFLSAYHYGIEVMKIYYCPLIRKPIPWMMFFLVSSILSSSIRIQHRKLIDAPKHDGYKYLTNWNHYCEKWWGVAQML